MVAALISALTKAPATRGLRSGTYRVDHAALTIFAQLSERPRRRAVRYVGFNLGSRLAQDALHRRLVTWRLARRSEPATIGNAKIGRLFARLMKS